MENNKISYEYLLDEKIGDGLMDDVVKKADLIRYHTFCKYFFKCKSQSFSDKKLEEVKLEELKRCNIKEGYRNDNSFKKEKIKDFHFNWLKKKYFTQNTKNKVDNNIRFSLLQSLSGVHQDYEQFKNQIKNLIPCSFGIWVKFKLKQPYFSKDDDEFYLIQNPILKEKVFKAPMIRGSGWKGAVAKAGIKVIEEKIENDSNSLIDDICAFTRIFGAGNEEFRKLIEIVDKHKDKDSFAGELISYTLFTLGAKITKKVDESLRDFVERLWEDIEEELIKVQRGRAVFYPTYFDTLSLEVINPHSRRRRAGTQPIFYEVVPEGDGGILQIIYVPFDGILKPDNKLQKETEKDLVFLASCIEKVANSGVGAKTKLGWGTFEILDKKIFLKGENFASEGGPKGWGTITV